MLDGLLQILNGGFNILCWQPKHQIQIDIIKSCLLGDFCGLTGVSRVMHTLQSLELLVMLTLNAYRQTIDTCFTVRIKALLFKGAGVGLKRNLHTGTHGKQGI